ncbi:hypothetical protein HOLleu_11554 [Holothuria leucospilota]|uniref:Uncharacterized protein n=1 Tax=Holothuria leucospilota TaxID=206669 RepID=A0A9Q1CFU8_HOLLE|nr:hypothetical protein HOLleu_11554 [Holothuria leucospilota]
MSHTVLSDWVRGIGWWMALNDLKGSGAFFRQRHSSDVMAVNMIYDLLPFVLSMKEGEFDLKEHDLLEAFVERFKAQDKIADWIKKRPKTQI